MFNALSKGLSGLIRKLITGTSIDKKSVEEILVELKKILLQADVETKLADDLISRIRKKTLEEKIPAGLTLREHVLKVVYDELVSLLGGSSSGVDGKKRIMVVGLFGSGKTTSIGKLAKYFLKRNLKPALVALDFYRPAATEQLQQIGKQIGVQVYVHNSKNSAEAAEAALKNLSKYDVLIFDTAGRNALDKQLADELKTLSRIVKPDEVLLTIPADLGKVAKVQAEEFHKIVGITGVIVTKMDGTAKGGGALAAASVTGAKVKFIGTGEHLDDFELYDSTRFVSRLLGLGDLQTLLEKAKESELNPAKAQKIIEGKFTLQDFMEQIEAMAKMGPLQQIASMIPGLGGRISEDVLRQQEEKMKKYKYIIQSMTKLERQNPDLIEGSRVKRIAKGSGCSEAEVRELLNQYNQMRKVMRMLGGKAGLERGQLKNLAKQFGFKI